MSTMIECNDAIVLCEVIDLLMPYLQRTRDAMNQHNWIAFVTAEYFGMYSGSVWSADQQNSAWRQHRTCLLHALFMATRHVSARPFDISTRAPRSSLDGDGPVSQYTKPDDVGFARTVPSFGPNK
jgi:hypothetical protein